MPDPWWKARPLDLHRVEDRVSSIYVERTHIGRSDNAVVLINKERTVRVPAQLILRQAYLVTRTKERLGVARRMYGMRFPGEETSELNMQHLRGREGSRVRKSTKPTLSELAYPGRSASMSRKTLSLPAMTSIDIVGANSALYGICHAVIAGIGASPALGFVHTGSAISFVLDIADLYKADLSIPMAFDLAAAGLTTERDARIAVREKLTELRLMPRIIRDIKTLLSPEGEATSDLIDTEVNELWNDQQGSVPGGVDWSVWDHPPLLEEASQLSIIGPEFDTQPEQRDQ